MSEAKQIVAAVRLMGFYPNPKDSEFLTDEHIKKMREEARELLPDGESPFGEHTWLGNHFYATSEGGVPYWHWQDVVGSQCGTARPWKYKVNVGDTVRQAGNCPQGYPWFEMVLHY